MTSDVSVRAVREVALLSGEDGNCGSVGCASSLGGIMQWASEHPSVAESFFSACREMARQGMGFRSIIQDVCFVRDVGKDHRGIGTDQLDLQGQGVGVSVDGVAVAGVDNVAGSVSGEGQSGQSSGCESGSFERGASGGVTGLRECRCSGLEGCAPHAKSRQSDNGTSCLNEPEGLKNPGVAKQDGKSCSEVDSLGRLPGETTTERNRRWKRAQRAREKENKNKKEENQKGNPNVAFDDGKVRQTQPVKNETVAPVDSLRASLETKWRIQNELAAEEARRKLEVLRANDIQDEVRRRATQVKRHTESNMVAIEKTHKFLSATGNVAGEPAGGQGFAETIIGESISPDSSASMQEFRAAQKQILDLQQEIEKLRKAYKKAGGNPDAIDLYDKSVFTMENGTIDQRYVDQFESLNLSWGIPENAIEYRNGKKKTRIDFYGVKDDDDFNNFYGDC